MGKAGWIVLVIVVLYLFKDRLFGAPGMISSAGAPVPPSYYYASPPPGTSWASSPATHVSQGPDPTAVAVSLIQAGGAALNTYLSQGDYSSPPSD